MSFNSKNLKKLGQFKEMISNSDSVSKESANKGKRNSSRLHPIETEEDPQKLFKELIKASPNGEVPNHLLKRLQELEERQLRKTITLDEANISNISSDSSTKDTKNSSQQSLYTSFQRLLLEED